MSYSVFKHTIQKINSFEDFTAFKNHFHCPIIPFNLTIFSIQQIFMDQRSTFVYARLYKKYTQEIKWRKHRHTIADVSSKLTEEGKGTTATEG